MSRTPQSWILGSHNTRTITSSTSSKGGLCKLQFVETVLKESQVFVDVVAVTSTLIMVKSATYVYRCVLTWTKMMPRFWYSFIRVYRLFFNYPYNLVWLYNSHLHTEYLRWVFLILILEFTHLNFENFFYNNLSSIVTESIAYNLYIIHSLLL